MVPVILGNPQFDGLTSLREVLLMLFAMIQSLHLKPWASNFNHPPQYKKHRSDVPKPEIHATLRVGVGEC